MAGAVEVALWPQAASQAYHPVGIYGIYDMPTSRAGSIPETMSAVAIVRPRGGVDALESVTVPIPNLADDEILIRVCTVAVNRQDLFMLRGDGVASIGPYPHVLGNDPAGVVVEIGANVRQFEVGDRVVVKSAIDCGWCRNCRDGGIRACESPIIVGVHRQGGHAEYIAVPEGAAFRIASSLSFPVATAVVQSYPVAANMLTTAGVKAGDVVLVAGASGSVGSAAVELASRVGATVIGAAGSTEGVASALARGASVGVDYRVDPHFSHTLRESFSSGVSVYLETAGAPNIWQEGLASLGRGGRVVVCGAHAGPLVSLDLTWLFRTRASVFGVAGSTSRDFVRMLEMASLAEIRPPIDSVRPLSEIHSAIARLERRMNQGKLVLEVAPE